MSEDQVSDSYASGFSFNTDLPLGSGSVATKTSNKVWFSGAYRYHVPMGNDVADRFRRYDSYANKLLGVNITPEVIWNISPWSWAADWFGNVGDVMHNISALGTDGLVIEYGYAMSSRLWEQSKFGSFVYQGKTYSSSVTETRKNLLRLPSTPFGFGFDLHSLTDKQTAILVALGLART